VTSADPGLPHTLDHAAFGVADAQAAGRVLAESLGGAPYSGGRNPAFAFWQYRFAGGAKLELIAPEGPEGGFLQRFLARRGPGFHHVTLYVRDLDAACARARSRGYEIVGHDASHAGWHEAFLHPKQAGGIVVQLAWSRPDEDGSLDPRWPFPEPRGTPPPPVRLVELALRARDEQAARRLWGELLGGAAERAPRGLRFRWPGNPMAIAVAIDPHAEEGPLHLAVAPDPPGRELALPPSPHPALGGAIVRA
jgi:catechol 2,3-dioxygenase-like lactoylglutathione lyase family enzyme